MHTVHVHLDSHKIKLPKLFIPIKRTIQKYILKKEKKYKKKFNNDSDQMKTMHIP